MRAATMAGIHSTENYDLEDFDPALFAALVDECRDFWTAHVADIIHDPERAGADFWLTRNGHGAGFWDGGWPSAPAHRLVYASKAHGPVDLYV